MAVWLKQSTAFDFELGPFVDSTDGFTAMPSLTIAATAVYVSKGGAALAAKNEATALTGTGDSLGFYACKLDATDTNTLGNLRVYSYVATALPVWQDFLVVPANVYNSVVAGSDKLYVDAVEIASSTSAATKQAAAAETCTTGTVFNDSGTYIPVITPATSLVFYSDDITEATADHFNGKVIGFTSGALAGQSVQIIDYEKVGSYGKFTTTVSTEIPADDVTFTVS